MLENDRISGCLDEINLEFVEREATPKLLTKLSIQLHLLGLSLSNTVSATPKQKLLSCGSDRSLSHGINLFEQYPEGLGN